MKIDNEFKNLIPALTHEEFTGLEQSCLERGIQDSIKTWQGIIIDGHNRYEIACRHGLLYDTKELPFDSRSTVVEWILMNQLSRRNLNPDQMSIIRGKLYNLSTEQGKRSDLTCGQVDHKLKTAEKLGEKYKVSEKTIRRDGKFVEDNPEVAEKILKGETTKREINKEKKKKDLESKKQQILKQTNQVIEDNKPIIYNESYSTWLSKMNGCDLLLTDPPYSTDIEDIDKFVNEWLFKALTKVKPTGAAYIFIGAYPNEVKAYLNAKISKHIRLEQILVWEYKNTLGNNPKDRYKLNYQNILFYKGIENKYFDCPITNEQWAVQSINAPDGRIGDRYHTWQKPLELAERLIRHSTKENDIVLDPFTCTGTFIIASNKLNRKGFGCDINKENVEIAIKRGCKLNE